MDFKYAMAMELDDPGFHHSVLTDFRDRLAEDDRADRLLDLALARLKEAGWCASAPLSTRIPPTSWPRCAT
ncbi:transposase [Streptomyces sp. NPDC056161]|uniref:transposase n=1 Tax=Streptomyces sp. NPDC056161 TaxID=3345732 RepID=UPI0035DECA3E